MVTVFGEFLSEPNCSSHEVKEGGGGDVGVASVKHEREAQAQILDIRPDDHTLAQVKVKRKKEGKESESDSGEGLDPAT